MEDLDIVYETNNLGHFLNGSFVFYTKDLFCHFYFPFLFLDHNIRLQKGKRMLCPCVAVKLCALSCATPQLLTEGLRSVALTLGRRASGSEAMV